MLLKFGIDIFGSLIKGYANPPPALRSGQIFMKDAECAELNEKRNKNFSAIFFSRLWVIIHRKLGLF